MNKFTSSTRFGTRGASRHQRICLKGFTLIELLVVISVIGLLVTIMLPSLGRARGLARRVACAGNLHAIAVGFRMYLDSSNDIMPYAAEMPSLGLVYSGATIPYPRIVDVLAKSVEDGNTFKCPADTEPAAKTGKTYFESEGSSYGYWTIHGGQHVDRGFLTDRFGAANVPVMNDYEAFHGEPGTLGSANYLFADCHVGDMID
ncbi:MAG: type II secretion system protein [Phycisphaerae bacterium]|nr:type II secretion system protein [Phycisphaerae bacterium]